MKAQTRQKFIFVHVVLAGFFLPAAVMFAITGGMYTYGNKGEYNTQNFTVQLPVAEAPTLPEMAAIAEAALKQQGETKLPTGGQGLSKVGTSWRFEWTGSNFDFTIEPTTEAGVLKASIKRTTLHRFFVQLHKAKGGEGFKVMAAGLALALLSLFASGCAMAFASPALKRNLFVSLALGLVAFAGLAFLS